MDRGKVASILTVVAVIAALVVASALPAVAQRPIVTINKLSSPAGSGHPEAWQLIGSLLAKKHPWLRLNVQETSGYFFNLKAMIEDPWRYKDTMAGIEFYGLSVARTGRADFPAGLKNFKPTVLIYDSVWSYYLITPNPEVKTLYDLKGKRLITGLKGGTTGQSAISAVEAAGLKDHTRIEFITFARQIDAMNDGLGDAVWVFTPGNAVTHNYTGPIMITEAKASGKPYRAVGVPAEVIKKMKDSGLDVFPLTTPRDILDRPGPITVIGIVGGTLVDATFPEDVAYELTKFVVQNAQEIAESAKWFRYW
ncbi:MAG: hypothetical protein HY725_01760, partial [Candidatus Rokubacteria bacterium]|nr:hypothetical protein [Candidatus Rokubacteria bacterium]